MTAEHDMVLGPVLRNSGVPGNGSFLSTDTRHKSEKSHTPHCSSDSRIRMLWLHSYLRLRFDCRYCSRFAVQRITDFRPLDPFSGTFLPQNTKAAHREGQVQLGPYRESGTAIQDLAIRRQFNVELRWLRFVPDFGFWRSVEQ